MLPQALTINDIKIENSTTKTFVLAGSLVAAPGQFVMAWLPRVDERPFSLAESNPVTLTIAAVGNFSRAIHQLQIGDKLWVRGPLGRGYQLPGDPLGFENQTNLPHQAMLIGGGYGVAPLHFLAKRLLTDGHHVAVIIGARDEANLLCVDKFKSLGVSVWLTTEDGTCGQRGRVTDALVPLLADSPNKPHMVYACGPTGMLEAVAKLCQVHRLPFQVSWEAHMRCGVGLCGSCEVGHGWLTCLDGPVFGFNPKFLDAW